MSRYKMKSQEDDITFFCIVETVEPTQEEKERAWGRDCYNADQYVDAYGGSYEWVQVVEVIDPPRAVGDAIDGPVMSELLGPWIRKGYRFPILSTEDGYDLLDEGDASCQVVVYEGEG